MELVPRIDNIIIEQYNNNTYIHNNLLYTSVNNNILLLSMVNIGNKGRIIRRPGHTRKHANVYSRYTTIIQK